MHCSLAGYQQRLQLLHRRSLARGSGCVAGEHRAGCPLGIQGVGLGTTGTARSNGPLDLEHLLALAVQEAGEAGAVAPCPLERPHTISTRPARHLSERIPVTRLRGRVGVLMDTSAGCGLEHAQGMRVFVRVDADDVAPPICEHELTSHKEVGWWQCRS